MVKNSQYHQKTSAWSSWYVWHTTNIVMCIQLHGKSAPIISIIVGGNTKKPPKGHWFPKKLVYSELKYWRRDSFKIREDDSLYKKFIINHCTQAISHHQPTINQSLPNHQQIQKTLPEKLRVHERGCVLAPPFRVAGEFRGALPRQAIRFGAPTNWVRVHDFHIHPGMMVGFYCWNTTLRIPIVCWWF